MTKINKTTKTILKILIFAGLFIGYNACKKDYIDWAKLRQDEINAREAYIIDNEIIADSITTNGLYYIEIGAGTGLEPTAGRLVHVVIHNSYLLDGSSPFKADTISYTHGTGGPIFFGAPSGIAGFDVGLNLMKKGGKATLIIPSSLAYSQSTFDNIPRYSTLIFDIELLNVQ